MTIPKHPNDDGRVLKHEDGTDFDDELRFVHFDYLQNKYKNDRRNEFLSIGDQLDLLYKDIIAGTLDANGGFAKAVKKVKDNNPKSS